MSLIKKAYFMLNFLNLKSFSIHLFLWVASSLSTLCEASKSHLRRKFVFQFFKFVTCISTSSNKGYFGQSAFQFGFWFWRSGGPCKKKCWWVRNVEPTRDSVGLITSTIDHVSYFSAKIGRFLFFIFLIFYGHRFLIVLFLKSKKFNAEPNMVVHEIPIPNSWKFGFRVGNSWNHRVSILRISALASKMGHIKK